MDLKLRLSLSKGSTIRQNFSETQQLQVHQHHEACALSSLLHFCSRFQLWLYVHLLSSAAHTGQVPEGPLLLVLTTLLWSWWQYHSQFIITEVQRHGVTCPVSHRAQSRAGTGLLIQSLTITLRKQLLKMKRWGSKRHMDLRDAKLGECQYRPIVQHRDRYSVKFCIAQYSVVAYMGKKIWKRVNICTYIDITDSLYYTPKTNTML